MWRKHCLKCRLPWTWTFTTNGSMTTASNWEIRLSWRINSAVQHSSSLFYRPRSWLTPCCPVTMRTLITSYHILWTESRRGLVLLLLPLLLLSIIMTFSILAHARHQLLLWGDVARRPGQLFRETSRQHYESWCEELYTTCRCALWVRPALPHWTRFSTLTHTKKILNCPTSNNSMLVCVLRERRERCGACHYHLTSVLFETLELV